MGLSDLLYGSSNKTDSIFLQPCIVSFVTILLQQVCIRVVRTTFHNKSDILANKLQQLVTETNLLTAGLLTDLLQVVRFLHLRWTGIVIKHASP